MVSIGNDAGNIDARADMDALEHALAENPRDPMCHCRMAASLAACGDGGRALAHWRAALGLDPACLAALRPLAGQAVGRGQGEAALALLRRALAVAGPGADLLEAYGEVLLALGRAEEAAALFERALQHAPDRAGLWDRLGLALRRAHRLGAALAAFRRALDLTPGDVARESRYGVALADCGDLERSLALQRRLLDRHPGAVGLLTRYGATLLAAGRPAAAEVVLRDALAGDPGAKEASFALAVALLAQGRYGPGFAAYEGRFDSGHVPRRVVAGMPVWGGESLAGGSLLVHPEQSMGDIIQFCRYLPLVAARGVRVVFRCPGPLRPVLDTLGGPVTSIDYGAAPPVCDAQISLISLAHRLGTEIDTVPTPGAYLRRPAGRAVPAILAAAARPRIGLIWAGPADTGDDPGRWPGLRALAPVLARPRGTLFALQTGAARAQIDALGLTGVVHDLGLAPDDFGAGAALLSELDLLISVDGALAHLAAAMGRPVKLLLGAVPDWRWGLAGADSPWYRAATLFRQGPGGDWSAAVADLAADLEREGDDAR